MQGDKGFNSRVNTDDSFDKYRRRMAGGGGGGGVVEGSEQSPSTLSLILRCLSVSISLALCVFSSYNLFLSAHFQSAFPSFILSCVSLDQTGEALHALPSSSSSFFLLLLFIPYL